MVCRKHTARQLAIKCTNYNREGSLEEPYSVRDELPTDGTDVHLLGTLPTQLVSAEEGRVAGLCQTH